jgi:hypothetical protein
MRLVNSKPSPVFLLDSTVNCNKIERRAYSDIMWLKQRFSHHWLGHKLVQHGPRFGHGARAEAHLGRLRMAALARFLSATFKLHLRPTVTWSGITSNPSGYRLNHMQGPASLLL